MNIELKEISVRELTNGYKDNNDDGVVVMVENLIFVRLTKENLYMM